MARPSRDKERPSRHPRECSVTTPLGTPTLIFNTVAEASEALLKDLDPTECPDWLMCAAIIQKRLWDQCGRAGYVEILPLRRLASG